MDKTLVITIAGIGCTAIIARASIVSPIRRTVLSWWNGWGVDPEFYDWCMMCTGFWVGLLMWAYGLDLTEGLPFGLAIAVNTCYHSATGWMVGGVMDYLASYTE